MGILQRLSRGGASRDFKVGSFGNPGFWAEGPFLGRPRSTS